MLPSQSVNACNYGHETDQEIRRLPTGEESSVALCHEHYAAELENRRMTHTENPEWWDDPKWFPRWEDLEIYEPAVVTRPRRGA
jgi:hypothetical protein